ncbi:MAG: LPS export ABC transporter periplasmic protein LptC [Bacteroidia bacterium]
MKFYLSLFIYFLFLFSCRENDLAEVASLSEDKDLPQIVMENAEIEFNDSSRLQAIIAGGLVESFTYFDEDNDVQDQKLVMSKGVNGRFYSEQGVVNSVLTANNAVRYEKEKKTEIDGNVVVVNSQGDSLSTEFLLWDEKSETISSNRKVRVKTSDEIIFAEGFSSDMNFQEYTFKKVTGTISLN